MCGHHDEHTAKQHMRQVEQGLFRRSTETMLARQTHNFVSVGHFASASTFTPLSGQVETASQVSCCSRSFNFAARGPSFKIAGTRGRPGYAGKSQRNHNRSPTGPSGRRNIMLDVRYFTLFRESRYSVFCDALTNRNDRRDREIYGDAYFRASSWGTDISQTTPPSRARQWRNPFR